MVVIAPPNPESRRIADMTTDLEKRMKRVEAGLRAAQLGNSSMQGTGIGLYDKDGNYRGSVGVQPDGSAAVVSTPPTPPPIPTAPQVLPAFGPTLIVKAVGETADGTGWPADWLSNPLYKVYYADAANPTVWILGGTITGQSAETVVGPLEYTQYNFALTSVGPTGLESEKSQVSSGTPTQVVSQDLINGIIEEVHLNAGIVSEAKLKADAVTATKIADNAIETPHLTAGAVTAGKIAADQINAGHLTAGSVTTEKIQALAVTANELAANSVTAGKINAGAVTAVKLEANMVIASRIIAGSATGARVEMHPTSGLQAYQSDGTTRTFHIDAATGKAFFMGEISTAPSSTTARVIINPGGTVPDEIRFYQGSSYAWINAEAGAATNQAAVAMRSSVVSSRQGGVYTYGSETAMEHRATANPQPNTGYQVSAVSCVGDATNIWGGHVRLEGRADWGAGIVEFAYRNSSDTYVSDARLQYRAYGNNTPYLYGVRGDMGWLWQHNGEMWLGRPNAALTGAFSAYWNTPSGRANKRNERAARFREGSARAAIRKIPAKHWSYNNETLPDEQSTPEQRVVKILKYDPDTGRTMVGKDGQPLYDEETIETAPLIHKPHLFPIAEDMLPYLPELVWERDDIPGGYAADLRDFIGFLWETCRELDAELEALKRRMPGGPA